ncbi:MAG TPA: Tol-Pal system beta propeller repeat protein TolB [Caulobacteraceae bacterium]|jgi:TolB protein|nr:Tol-Pal system beta propeller repeat protein TolB [Caulobacteraceae bacterium]
MRLRILFVAVAAVLVAFDTSPRGAEADIVVDVNSGTIAPMPIAIAPFAGEHGAEIAQVVSADLERSGYFKPIDPAGFVDKSPDVNVRPNFDDWKKVNAQTLVDGAGTQDSDGRLRVSYRLWDVPGANDLLDTTFTTTPENWRRIAHKIADQIYEKVTGQTGFFDTQVVFVAESGPRGHRVKKLAIMDQDGANPQYLTSSSTSQVMMPHYSPNGQQVTYMTLSDNQTEIHLLNLETTRSESLGHISGLVFSPSFSPDGDKVAYSQTIGGNTDIWVMDLRTQSKVRLTVDPGIDTSPSFSPDGRRMVFNSDRSGSPQLYVMNADGSGVRRISQGGGRYNTPVWSPTGDLIAFTKQQGGGFSIGIMAPDGGGEKILSTSYFEEGPTWAPNGRYIMFHRQAQGGEPHLWMVDITGRVSHAAPYTLDASDPAWSPLRK